MEAKYYKPDISEIHVGGEYEVLVEERGWLRMPVIAMHEIMYLLNNWSVDDCPIRVKYLDRSDIEALGWELHHEYGAFIDFKSTHIDQLGKHDGPYRLRFMKIPMISEPEGTIMIFRAIGLLKPDDQLERILIGVIKNKSELRRLMVQLGITKEA